VLVSAQGFPADPGRLPRSEELFALLLFICDFEGRKTMP
jgi:hypothetical protein